MRRNPRITGRDVLEPDVLEPDVLELDVLELERDDVSVTLDMLEGGPAPSN